MEKELNYISSLTFDGIKDLKLYVDLYGDLIKAFGFSEDSYYFQSYEILNRFFVKLVKESYKIDSSGCFDIFLKESDSSFSNEK